MKFSKESELEYIDGGVYVLKPGRRFKRGGARAAAVLAVVALAGFWIARSPSADAFKPSVSAEFRGLAVPAYDASELAGTAAIGKTVVVKPDFEPEAKKILLVKAGSFRKEASVSSALKKLKKAGFDAFSEKEPGGKIDVYVRDVSGKSETEFLKIFERAGFKKIR